MFLLSALGGYLFVITTVSDSLCISIGSLGSNLGYLVDIE
jgi:hypothetical protein